MHTTQIVSMSSPVTYHVKVENQTTFVSNTSTNRVTMTILLILYIDEQIRFVRENNSNECSNHNTKLIYI